MAFTAAGFDNFVNDTAFKVLDAVKEAKPDMVRNLFMEVPWVAGSGDSASFTSLTLSGYAQRVDESENYPEVNPTEGDTLTKRQIQYGDKLNITRRMAKFNRYPEAVSEATALAERLMNVLDLELTIQIFNEADQITFTPIGKSAVNIATADTLALESASHTVNGIGGTFSNTLSGAGALSEDNLTSALQAADQNLVDDQGTAIAGNWDTMIIPNDPYMIRKAKQLLGSSLEPETANNAVNVYDGIMKLVVLKHGTKDTIGAYSTANRYAWAILDSKMSRGGLQVMMAESPSVDLRDVSSDNLLASILVTQFAAFAAIRWQGLFYSRSTTQP